MAGGRRVFGSRWCNALALCLLFLFLLTISILSLPLHVGAEEVGEEASGGGWRAGLNRPHPIQEEMRPFVEDMLEHALHGYLTFAFPHDDLRPLSASYVDGMGGLAVTLIDSLDMVGLMGRHQLFRRLARWVEENISFDVNRTVSVFETNIRIVGGLLAAHFLYEEGIVPVVREEHDYHGGLLRLAADLADRLLPAFNTATGVPYGSVNLRTGVLVGEVEETANAAGGTLLMEMTLLSRVTGDSKYEAVARRAAQAVFDLRDEHTALSGNHLNITSGVWTVATASVGTGIDSTIEYAVKSHALSGVPDEFVRFDVMRGAASRSLRLGGFYTEADMVLPTRRFAIYHNSLASFYAGNLLYGGKLVESVESAWAAHCLLRHSGVMPENTFLNVGEGALQKSTYPLRPEHVESLYHLYRATGDPVFLEMGREFALGLHLRTRTGYAFAALQNTAFPHSRTNNEDTMESFLISETLKYLYLLFDECNPIHTFGPRKGRMAAYCASDPRRTKSTSGVGWVFTTEAHTLPNRAEWWTPTTNGGSVGGPRAIPAGMVDDVVSSPERSGQTLDPASMFGSLLSRIQGFAKPEGSSAGNTTGVRVPQLIGANLERLARHSILPLHRVRVTNVENMLKQVKREMVTDGVLPNPFWTEAEGDTTLFRRRKAAKGDARADTQMAAYRYYCSNHAVRGVDRLSKAVFRAEGAISRY